MEVIVWWVMSKFAWGRSRGRLRVFSFLLLRGIKGRKRTKRISWIGPCLCFSLKAKMTLLYQVQTQDYIWGKRVRTGGITILGTVGENKDFLHRSHERMVQNKMKNKEDKGHHVIHGRSITRSWETRKGVATAFSLCELEILVKLAKKK